MITQRHRCLTAYFTCFLKMFTKRLQIPHPSQIPFKKFTKLLLDWLPSRHWPIPRSQSYLIFMIIWSFVGSILTGVRRLRCLRLMRRLPSSWGSLMLIRFRWSWWPLFLRWEYIWIVYHRIRLFRRRRLCLGGVRRHLISVFSWGKMHWESIKMWDLIWRITLRVPVALERRHIIIM